MRTPVWMAEALCAEVDPDLWFPPQGEYVQARTAKRICAACPVRAECLDYALAGASVWHGTDCGIWGGTTPRERHSMRRARRKAA